MSVIADLENLMADLDAMLVRTNGDGDVVDARKLSFTDTARLKGILIEAKVLLDDGLGRLNDFSGILSRVHTRAGLSVGATTGELAEAMETVNAGLRRLRRIARDASSSAGWAPAADRYVSFSDNQREQIQEDLADLKEVVRGDNNISEDERQIVLCEIALFEASIALPMVSLDVVKAFVNGALMWIGRTVVNAAASELVKRLGLALLGS
jgi:hypothetical protein